MILVTLGRRLRAIAQEQVTDIVFVSCRNFLLGAQMTHTGWQLEVDRHPRFFRRGSLTFSRRIHSVPTYPTDARVLELPATDQMAIIHFNYVDVEEFLAKLNRYTSVEASECPDENRPSAWAGLWWASREFWQRYVRCRGFRDGWRGWTLALLMAVYRFAVWAKHRERIETGGRPEIERQYGALAAEILAEWEEQSTETNSTVNAEERARGAGAL